MKGPHFRTIEDETETVFDTVYMEASVLVGHTEAAKLLLTRLSGTGVCISGFFYPTCVHRHMGGQ